MIESTLRKIIVSCFEIKNYIECLYANINYYYILAVFDIYNLNKIYYNSFLDNTQLNSV